MKGMVFLMKIFKATWILFFLHAIMMLAHSRGLGDLVGSILTLPPPCSLTVSHLLHVVGGRQEFQEELMNAVAEASLLRNRMPASLVDLKVGNRIIAKICFIDGICWAAKMVEILDYDRPTIHAIQALILVQRYCPVIPISKIKGCSERKLRYCFTEWLEGKSLADELEFSRNTSISIPEKLVTSLAEFIFNLTMCPIPMNECKQSILSLD